MKHTYMIGLLILVSFSIGTYVWSVQNTGKKNFLKSEVDEDSSSFEEGALAQVGDEYIFPKDLEFENLILLKSMQGPLPKKESSFKHKILSSAIERKILYKFLLEDPAFDPNKAGREKDCLKIWERAQSALSDFSEADKQRLKERICEQAIIEQYCQERVFKKTSIKEEDLLKYFEEHQQEFQVLDEVKIRQIVLATEKEARWVMERLTSKNFSQMAETHSIGPEGRNGGKLDSFRRGQLPQVFDVAFTLPLAKPAGIFKSTYGFHLIIVDERRGPRKLSFLDVKDRIQKILVQKQDSLDYRDWVESATRTIPVRILKKF